MQAIRWVKFGVRRRGEKPMGNPVDPFGKGDIKYGDAGERQAVERLLMNSLTGRRSK